MVAIEQYFPHHQRIFTDNLVSSVLPVGASAFVWALQLAFARDWMVLATERAFPGLWSGMMCRKRYCDEALIASSGEVEAVVNLGASSLTHTTVGRLTSRLSSGALRLLASARQFVVAAIRCQFRTDKGFWSSTERPLRPRWHR
ncbi:class I SAM-dependent methyltransferase [Bradyrhizobium japonicum]|uniref:class I SAM-dependent methyltransferase n=1 Tax=Bradyrhizobium japonicum TaxID=375 RepID=UPI001BA79E25|nr:class I SAM-dependent methyltransferase [Bradyrhizobium japonicum]MBR0750529.1 class I SAM-dependent methyltransferase [Bradyrhizobium japonicum]